MSEKYCVGFNSVDGSKRKYISNIYPSATMFGQLKKNEIYITTKEEEALLFLDKISAENARQKLVNPFYSIEDTFICPYFII